MCIERTETKRGDSALRMRLSFRSSLFRKTFECSFDAIEPSLELGGWQRRVGRSRAETWISAPPIQADLLGFVDRTHKKSYLNRQQLDVREIDLDVASHDQSLVENPVENVD